MHHYDTLLNNWFEVSLLNNNSDLDGSPVHIYFSYTLLHSFAAHELLIVLVTAFCTI